MFEQILVPLDGSQLTECVLPHAVAMAQAFQSRLLLLRVVDHPQTNADPVRMVDPLHWQVRKTEAKAYLDAITVRLRETGLITEEHLVEGRPAGRIVQFARDRDVGLILLSSHGLSGLSRWNVSSVAQKVIFQADKPVMIVRAYLVTSGDVTKLSYERILIPVDGSLRAEHVLPYALHLAHSHDARLMLAHVIKKPRVLNPSSLLDDEVKMVERIEAHNKIEVDLVILNAHGYTRGLYWPYSSLALSFIAYGAKPLLIVQDLSSEELEQTQAEIAARESRGH